MKIVQLTTHDGRRVGIPPGTAIMIWNLADAPEEERPLAKTLIRYTLDGQRAWLAYVKDEFKHVTRLFPLAFGGSGWQHVTDPKGNAYLIPDGSITSYEELEARDGFTVTLQIPTGPIFMPIGGTYEDLLALIGDVPNVATEPAPPPPEVESEPRPTRARSRSGNGAGG